MRRNRIYKYLILPYAILALTGCEKYVKYVNAPEYEQKLVITSFISPSDKLSIINVSSNQRLYGYFENGEEPGDVTGTISDGVNEIELDTISGGFCFTQDRMPIVPGNSYTIKISSSKGLYAEATATIPPEHDFIIGLDTFSVVHDGAYDYGQWTEFKVTAFFNDFPDEKNYYSITGKFTGFINSPDSDTEIYTERLWFEKRFFKDLIATGDNSINLEAWFSRSFSYYDSAFISVYLMNTEESYYLYHTSLDQFEQSDNPFSETKPVFSNIKNGLGIFTSYTLDSLHFRLK
jgi:hypothetical protein